VIGSAGAVDLAWLALALRQNSNFMCSVNLICPVQPLTQKYSAFVFPKNMIDCLHSAPTQGAYRDRHERGAEGGGRSLC
jgi:hypothetical protein